MFSGTRAGNVAVLAGQTVECAYTGDYCVDSGERTSGAGSYDCTYIRKLCVECVTETDSGGRPTGATKVHVQGNGLPVNCFTGNIKMVE